MKDNWVCVAAAQDVREGATLQGRLGDEPVCLYRIGGRIYATHDRCTHGRASLADGTVRGEEIECALHKGRFHVPSGRAVGLPCVRDIRTYSVKVENDAVWLESTEHDDEDLRQ